MKLDIECVRDVLLEIEKLPMGCHQFTSLEKSIKKYGNDNVLYTAAKLIEADYVIADIPMDEDGYYHAGEIYCMKFAGHQFLDQIRDEKRWGTVKSVLSAIKDYSLSAIKAVAEGFTAAALEVALEKLEDGLPVVGQ